MINDRLLHFHARSSTGCNGGGLQISFYVEIRRRAARQKRKGSAQENGGTVHHEVLADGMRQRKPQQHSNSALGTFAFL